ncbi:MAG: thiamine phosphate synthase [Verrucomicrobiota bacterium]|nr:thiamine phosphate synthase [Verrucomicrobiota bacterium]
MARPDLTHRRLYGILDLAYVEPIAAERVAADLVRGGVDLLQLRGKGQSVAELEELAIRLHPITRAEGIPLVINDHATVARAVRSEGIHVGQDDASVAEARLAAGPDCLVGKSTHSVAQAVAAAEEGADYIGFGPLFATPTKPDYTPIGIAQIREVHARVRIPIFCIGGIKLENLAALVAAGARRVVIVSGLLQAADVAEYARAAREMLAANQEK